MPQKTPFRLYALEHPHTRCIRKNTTLRHYLRTQSLVVVSLGKTQVSHRRVVPGELAIEGFPTVFEVIRIWATVHLAIEFWVYD